MIRLGLVGWPVSHSLSPRLHSAALRAAGLQGEYNLYPVNPSEPGKLAEILALVRSGELAGLNVTIPFKQAVNPLVEYLTPSARMIGAVNTIYLENDRLWGHNTDAPGFLADLLYKTGDLGDELKNSIVLGAGGSARAVVWALMENSFRVTVAARKLDQAQAMAEYFSRSGSPGSIHPIQLDSRSLLPLLRETGLIVNSTPVGMSPDINFSPWPDKLHFPAEAFIYDLVYNPSETFFLQQARAAGLRTTNGMGMLVEQAALAFELWTGKPAPRAEMTAAISPVNKN